LVSQLIEGDPAVGFDFHDSCWGFPFVDAGKDEFDDVRVALPLHVAVVFGVPPGLESVDDVGRVCEDNQWSSGWAVGNGHAHGREFRPE
jgi:hypothetical protein